MVDELFDWKQVDILDEDKTQWIDCTLKRNVGPYPAGRLIRAIDIDWAAGIMKFYETLDQSQPSATFQLKLEVK